MHTVYILKSQLHPAKLYIGLTTDLPRRLTEHNRDTRGYANQYAPWTLEVSIDFKTKKTAEDFEVYLKSGSGFAFIKKRFLPIPSPH